MASCGFLFMVVASGTPGGGGVVEVVVAVGLDFAGVVYYYL